MTTTEPAAPGAIDPEIGPIITGSVRPDLRPSGVNHLAIATSDMKAQLTFFADVLGCPARALYWMHGVENTFHGFVELSPESYVAFVQHPDNPTDTQWGVTHAGNPGAPVTAGATQHIALHVDTIDDVLAMRDRIRSRGVHVMGPIDHGFCKSIYFAGPEGLSLEVCCGSAIDERQWVDSEVQELCGIDDDELARLLRPEPLDVTPGAPIAQPSGTGRPQMHYPPEVYDVIMSMSDGAIWSGVSETTPPVALPE